MSSPMQELTRVMRQSGLIRFMEHYEELFPSAHLKDLVVEEVGPGREMVVRGRRVVNFGSDSFLGLDRDPRVLEAIHRGLAAWGSHNGTSRAFSSVRANALAEEKLAAWLGTEASLIFPSVSLANLGALPGLVGRQDLLVVDEQAHNSIQDGARIAKANGTRVVPFSHCDPEGLRKALDDAGPYRLAVVAIDGVYSMTGELPPLRELNGVAVARRAVLYVDDAHASGVVGPMGRGTVLAALGDYDNALVVGSLSKGLSCAGAFIGCTRQMQRLLKMRSNTYIFGGPVVPAYLEAVCVVCDLLAGAEYGPLIARLRDNQARLRRGLEALGLVVQGGEVPIVSVLVGGEEETLRAGAFLFEAGHYVQSVTFPAVPYHAGVLRIQVNANHTPEQIDGLLEAVAGLSRAIELPTRGSASKAA